MLASLQACMSYNSHPQWMRDVICWAGKPAFFQESPIRTGVVLKRWHPSESDYICYGVNPSIRSNLHRKLKRIVRQSTVLDTIDNSPQLWKQASKSSSTMEASLLKATGIVETGSRTSGSKLRLSSATADRMFRISRDPWGHIRLYRHHRYHRRTAKECIATDQLKKSWFKRQPVCEIFLLTISH